jgi:2-polyprenyl-3-methyl-5-hydroxy-6-metoxy-1,4-benzoquinol methylase
MYRFPKDPPTTSVRYYQSAYQEGLTTELPDETDVARWLCEGFGGSEKDLSEKIRIVQSLTSGRAMLDYGCSWGYGVRQFAQTGFDAAGYEIGVSRAKYGIDRLGAKIFTLRDELLAQHSASFDVVFANHVVEHLAEPRAAFEDFRQLLKPGGLLVGFVPNGGGKSARRQGARWGPLIGEKHPLAVDASFLRAVLPRHALCPRFASSPYRPDAVVLTDETDVAALPGDELLVVAERVEG